MVKKSSPGATNRGVSSLEWDEKVNTAIIVTLSILSLVNVRARFQRGVIFPDYSPREASPRIANDPFKDLSPGTKQRRISKAGKSPKNRDRNKISLLVLASPSVLTSDFYFFLKVLRVLCI